MFIKVMFGAGCSVLVNTSCRLVNLTAHLRQKAGLPPDASLHVLSATIALLAEDGNLVSLEEDLKEGAAWTQTMGNSLLKERAIYVLIRTISKRERTWSPPAMSPYWRTWMTITQSWQVQTDSNPARLLLQNLELLRSCISKRGKVRQDLRLLGAPKLWVQRMGCGGRDKKGRGGRYP
nr:uncharacterized protein C22orf15 homolog isoform X12 [Macaca nemestrina]